jgi:hypothetical protein
MYLAEPDRQRVGQSDIAAVKYRHALRCNQDYAVVQLAAWPSFILVILSLFGLQPMVYKGAQLYI